MNRVLLLLALLILVSNRLYDVSFIGEGNEVLLKFLSYVTFAILTVVVYIEIVSRKNTTIQLGSHFTDKGVFLLFLGLLISIINALLFKGQDIVASLITSAGVIIAYLVYFEMRMVGFSIKNLEKLTVFFGWCYIVCVIIGFATLPFPLFGTFKFDEEHGGMRFSLPGIHWMNLMFFYYLSRYERNRKLKFLLYGFIAYLVILSSLTRQLIVLSTVLGGFYFFKMISRRGKIIFVFLFFILALFIVPNLTFVQNLKELTEEQASQNDSGREDVRVKDYRVFMFEYERNLSQYLFGCGLASYNRSEYGREMENLAETENLIQVDAGWAGFVFYYGYFSAFVLLVMMLACLKRRVPSCYLYLKYYVLFIGLCAIASGPILYNNEYIIVMLVLSVIKSEKKVNDSIILHRISICKNGKKKRECSK